MFKRINKKLKGLFSSQRMKTLALMLLVGTTAAMRLLGRYYRAYNSHGGKRILAKSYSNQV